MSGDETAEFIYLGIFAVALGAYVILHYRNRLSQGLQHFAIWILIFLGVVVAYGFKDTLQSQFFPRQGNLITHDTVTLPRARDGHFYVDLQVNDEWITFLIDTGATDIVLNQEDASRIGVKLTELRYSGVAYTANGEVRTAATTIDEIRLQDFLDTNVWASVNEGDLDMSLLGMRYLQLFDRFEIVGDTLYLGR